jgi:hypothetical protein
MPCRPPELRVRQIKRHIDDFALCRSVRILDYRSHRTPLLIINRDFESDSFSLAVNSQIHDDPSTTQVFSNIACNVNIGNPRIKEFQSDILVRSSSYFLGSCKMSVSSALLRPTIHDMQCDIPQSQPQWYCAFLIHSRLESRILLCALYSLPYSPSLSFATRAFELKIRYNSFSSP